MAEFDEGFFDRADEHIHLSNRQMKNVDVGMVSASMMYSVARFNAHVNALDWTNAEEMRAAREKIVDYFVGQYRKMFEENFDDYVDNFSTYMKDESKSS